MKSYAQIVERHRKYRIREMLPNDSLSHAAVLFHNILQAAIDSKLDVKIVSGSLMKQFYDQFVDKLNILLATNKVDVVLLDVDEDELRDNKFFEAVSKSDQGSIFRSSGIHSHFILAGDRIYRFETDHLVGEAIANFNDVTMGKWLLTQFDLLRGISSVYEPQAASAAQFTTFAQSV